MVSFQFTLLLLGGYISLSAAKLVGLTPSSIKETISNGIWLIKYSSLSCPHSEAFAPIWKQLADDFEAVATKRNLFFGTIDCTSFSDLCTNHQIDASPTLQMFENGEFKELYHGPKKYDELTAFINKNLQLSAGFDEGSSIIDKFEFDQESMSDTLVNKGSIYKELPNPRGVSISLDGKSLDQIIRSHEYWFIKFYSPSCPHCIALGPTWSQMASELRNQVNVAEVNCEALPSVCRQNSIPYVPLLRMYGGRSPLEYHGDRTLRSLVHFAKSNSRPLTREINSNSLDVHSSGEDTALSYLHSDGDDILESVEREKRPLVHHISNINMVMNDNRKLVIHIVGEENKMVQDKFYKIASHWSNLAVNNEITEDNDVLFAKIDFSRWRHFIQPKSEVTTEDNPQVIILDVLKSEYYPTDQNHQLFSMDNPENIYSALENLDNLTRRQISVIGESATTSLHNEYSIFSLHGFLFILVFITGAFILQKYYTYCTKTFSKTNDLLPSYQAIESISHKD